MLPGGGPDRGRPRSPQRPLRKRRASLWGPPGSARRYSGSGSDDLVAGQSGPRSSGNPPLTLLGGRDIGTRHGEVAAARRAIVCPRLPADPAYYLIGRQGTDGWWSTPIGL